MRVAVMQPYLFPYLGYFKLIEYVDLFIFLDNVQFIDRGWINRNYLLNNHSRSLFTLPLKSSSQITSIYEKEIALERYGRFWNKLEKACYHSYQINSDNSDLLKDLFLVCRKEENLCKLLFQSNLHISSLLDIHTQFLMASSLISLEESIKLSATDRIIELCKNVGATEYINLSGGRALYDSSDFIKKGITLNFLDVTVSDQFLFNGEPLSVLDTLMRFNKSSILNEIKNRRLI